MHPGVTRSPLIKQPSTFPTSNFNFCHSCETAQVLFLRTRKVDERFPFPCADCEPQVKKILRDRERWARGKALKGFLENSGNHSRQGKNRGQEICRRLLLVLLIIFTAFYFASTLFAENVWSKLYLQYFPRLYAHLQPSALPEVVVALRNSYASILSALWATYLILKLLNRPKVRAPIVLLPSGVEHTGQGHDSQNLDSDLLSKSFLHAFEQTLPASRSELESKPVFGKVSLGLDDPASKAKVSRAADEMDWEPGLDSASQSPIVEFGEQTFMPPVRYTGLEDVLECVKLEERAKSSWWSKFF